ncbi:MAG: hypothetical protein EHM64_15835 [Ignavibacteriae bacterium]|nr:MAG: hypothetical protein EHM64_15835 [Ignavibacteriota bacterium]
MNKQIASILIAAVLAGGIGFYGGMKYEQNQRPGYGTFTTAQQRQGIRPNNTGTGQRGIVNGGLTAGEVISKDATSITLKLQDGGSKIVLISQSTPVTESATSSANNIKVGERVTVIGTANQDGSISASSIRVGDLVQMR